MARRNSAFAQKVRNEIKKWDDFWHANNIAYQESMDFLMGNQWKEDESKLFERYNKVPLVMNKLAPLANHIIGEQCQNTPNLQVVPNDNVPEQTAEIREALIKEISLNSNAKQVYQTVFKQSLIGGFSAYATIVKYANDKDFNKDIEIIGFNDPCRCFWDLAALSPCKTDGMYAGWRTQMSRRMFASKYGVDVERKIGSSSTDDGSISFADDDRITFIDYFKRKYKTVKLYLLSNGKTMEKDELDSLEKVPVNDEELLMDEGEIVSVIDTRDSFRYMIMHYQIAGDFILDKEEFPSEQLPVIFVDQDSYFDKQGKQFTRPFFKDARDAQRYINYLATQSAYLLKISRYDQFMIAKGNAKSPDTQVAWRDPTNVQGALYYDEVPSGNKPEQLRPPELSASLTQQYERALRDIESSTGVYGTQIGQQGNEVSGDAIDARTQRGSYNTFIPFNSLNRAITVGGQIINEMIPKVYSNERLMKLTMSDQNIQDVVINKQKDPYGNEVENDMTQGEYTIRLMPGPSYEGQKVEALKSMEMVLRNNPQLFNMIADLYVENLPLPNNIQLRNRIRTIVPPDIIQAGKTGKSMPQQQGPSPEQQAQEAEMQFRQKQLEQVDKEIALKEKELQLKTVQAQHDAQIEIEKLKGERMELAATLQEQEMRYAAELHRTSADLQMSHADRLVTLLTHKEKSHENKPKRA